MTQIETKNRDEVLNNYGAQVRMDSGMEHEADRSELPSFFVPTVTTKASVCVCVF